MSPKAQLALSLQGVPRTTRFPESDRATPFQCRREDSYLAAHCGALPTKRMPTNVFAGPVLPRHRTLPPQKVPLSASFDAHGTDQLLCTSRLWQTCFLKFKALAS